MKTSLLAVLCAALLSTGSVWAQDWLNHSGPEIPPYLYENEYEESGTELLDAVDEQYPVSVQGTFYDRRLTDNWDRGDEIVDALDDISPVDTSRTIQDPWLHDPAIRGEDLVDRIDDYEQGIRR